MTSGVGRNGTTAYHRLHRSTRNLRGRAFTDISSIFRNPTTTQRRKYITRVSTGGGTPISLTKAHQHDHTWQVLAYTPRLVFQVYESISHVEALPNMPVLIVFLAKGLVQMNADLLCRHCRPHTELGGGQAPRMVNAPPLTAASSSSHSGIVQVPQHHQVSAKLLGLETT